MYGSDVIGHSLPETATFLETPKNQDVKITIMKQIDSKSYLDIPVTNSDVASDIVVEAPPVVDRKGVGIVIDDEEKLFNAELNKKRNKNKEFTNTI